MGKPISTKRLNHMIGVAEYMYNNAEKYALDKEEMYMVGLLHDIGYISGEKKDHEKYGAELTKAFSNDYHIPEISYLIEHHGDMPTEYIEKYRYVDNKLKLLWEADMSVDSTGENVGFDRRLADIEARYGEDSEPYQTSKQVIGWLKENTHKE